MLGAEGVVMHLLPQKASKGQKIFIDHLENKDFPV